MQIESTHARLGARIAVQYAATATPGFPENSGAHILPHHGEFMSTLAVRPAVVRTARPISDGSVGIVVPSRPQLKMGGLDARGIVALVPDDSASRDWSVGNMPGESVPKVLNCAMGYPVAIGIAMSGPLPAATIRGKLGSVVREALLGRKVRRSGAERDVRLSPTSPSIVVTAAVSSGMRRARAIHDFAFAHTMERTRMDALWRL